MLRWIRSTRPKVAYVTDDVRWSFYWDGYYLTRSMSRHAALRATVTRRPWLLKNQIVHFGDRYRFRERALNPLAASNRVFLTWFHGHHDDPDFAPLFEYLVDVQAMVEGVVTTCHDSYRHLVAAGVTPNRLHVIPLGVETGRFRPASRERRIAMRRKLGIPRDAFCVGSFQKDGSGWGEGNEPKLIKGPDVFLDVMQRLSGRRRNVFVLLAGPARGFVKRGLQQLGIPFRHDNLNRYWDLVLFYQVLDAYLITSRCEGGPKALPEAWACGVPVVSTRMGMPADHIRHGQDGWLADVGDVGQLVEGLEYLAEQPARRATMGAAGFEQASALDWNLIAQSYVRQVYRLPAGNDPSSVDRTRPSSAQRPLPKPDRTPIPMECET